MKRFEFTVIISGKGNDQDEAWEDAVNSFYLDPGIPLDDIEEVECED